MPVKSQHATFYVFAIAILVISVIVYKIFMYELPNVLDSVL